MARGLKTLTVAVLGGLALAGCKPPGSTQSSTIALADSPFLESQSEVKIPASCATDNFHQKIEAEGLGSNSKISSPPALPTLSDLPAPPPPPVRKKTPVPEKPDLGGSALNDSEMRNESDNQTKANS